MRTNVVLDDELVKKAFRTSGLKTKREVIPLADIRDRWKYG